MTCAFLRRLKYVVYCIYVVSTALDCNSSYSFAWNTDHIIYCLLIMDYDVFNDRYVRNNLLQDRYPQTAGCTVLQSEIGEGLCVKECSASYDGFTVLSQSRKHDAKCIIWRLYYVRLKMAMYHYDKRYGPSGTINNDGVPGRIVYCDDCNC